MYLPKQRRPSFIIIIRFQSAITDALGKRKPIQKDLRRFYFLPVFLIIVFSVGQLRPLVETKEIYSEPLDSLATKDKYTDLFNDYEEIARNNVK
jgi:hypothetical protein